MRSLEKQALVPMMSQHPIELGLFGHDREFLAVLRSDPIYRDLFPKAFSEVTIESVAKAVAKGLTFRPLATTAIETLAWFRAQPAERQAKPRTGLTPEREAEVLARWRASTTGQR